MITEFKRFGSMVALVLTFSSLTNSSMASIIQLDGVKTGADGYSNSFDTGWYNDHESLISPGQTTVWWKANNNEVALYIEAPLEVKNMIWGDYFNDLSNPANAFNRKQALAYYQAWCSPNDGNPAALNGSNCDHHNDGFDPDSVTTDKDKTFIGKIQKDGDFKTMIDSEKLTIDKLEIKLKATIVEIIETDFLVRTSLTYIFNNNATGELFEGCDMSGCGATETAMSYEFLFSNVAAGTDMVDWLMDGNNDLLFHMSPERGSVVPPVLGSSVVPSVLGGSVVPEPSIIALFVAGLFGIGFARRRQFL